MTRYASRTEVPVERSRAELERILHRYGCDAFAFGWDRMRRSGSAGAYWCCW